VIYRAEQTIRYRIKSDPNPGWYSKVIRGFNFSTNSLIFQDEELSIQEIGSIQSDQKGFFGRFVPGFLLVSGVNSILGSLTLWVVSAQEFPRTALIFGGASSTLGFILRFLTKKKVYHMDDNMRLQLIDLNLY